MADLPLYDSDETNDPPVHIQVLFNSLSDDEGWLTWCGIPTLRLKSGNKEELEMIFSNRRNGYLKILEELQKNGYEVNKNDLRVDLDEDGKLIDHGVTRGPVGGIATTVFVIEKDL